MTSLEKLDIVLLCLEKHHSEKRHDLISIAQILDKEKSGVEFGEINSILIKLQKDGYVHIQETAIGDFFMITFEGRVFNEQGGYVEMQQEKNRISLLEAAQRAANVRMVLLTRIVAIGTSVAALYYLLEMVKYFWHLFHGC